MFRIGSRSEDASTARPTVAQLAELAPYANLSPGALRTLAAASQLKAMPVGRLPTRWIEGQAMFLNSGEVELRTANDRRVFLSSVSPPARFPLPPPALAQVRAVEPATLILVPTGPARADAASATVPPAAASDPVLAGLLTAVEAKLREGEIPLPSMPGLAVKLNAALRDGDDRNDNQDVAKLIQLDPALATKIVHVVNSAAFRFARKANTVQQAVTRLGRDRVRNLAVGFLLRHAFDTDSPELRRRANAVWQRSCHVAAISFTLARQLPMLDPERAMLAGLIHQIGVLPLLGLARRHPGLFAAPNTLDRALRAFDRRLGRTVLERWALGDDLLEVVDHVGDWERVGWALPDYADVVLLAQLHADMGRPGFNQLPRIDRIAAYRKLELGKLSPRKSLQILEEAEREIQELRRILSSVR